MTLKSIKTAFLFAGLYDLTLGLAYLVAHETLFATFNVPAPGHPTYVEFPALLLVLFGVMFLQISTDPVRYREMMPYGMALKAAFAGLAFGYHFSSGVSFMWLPLATIDLIFLIVFVLAWRSTAQRAQ